MDEHARIAALAARYRRGDGRVIVGIGDDAAVLRTDGPLVATVDAAVEGVHFRRAFARLDALARRAFVAAASDLAAMGAEPLGALSSLVLPPDVDDEAFLAIVDGTAAAARELDCAVIGGNLSAGPTLSITTTVLGTARGGVLARGGARPGDVVYASGPPGDRALGLEVLLRRGPGASGALGELARAWLAPHARIAEGRAFVGRATAAIDVSDGLLADLGHLCAASGVGAVVDVGALPRHPAFHDVAAELGVAPLDCLLGGGEAYELVFTAPPGVDVAGLGVAIGRCTEGSAIECLDGGRPVTPPRAGFRHFR